MIQKGVTLQVFPREKAADGTRRIKPPMPEKDFVAVSEKNERVETMAGFYPVGIIRSLPFAFERAAGTPLGLDNRHRTAIGRQ